MALLFCHGIHQDEDLLERVFDVFNGWSAHSKQFISSRHSNGKDVPERVGDADIPVDSGVRVVLDAPKTSLFVGEAVRVTTSDRVWHNILRLYDDSNNQVLRLRIMGDNSIQILDASNNELARTNGGLVDASTWISLTLHIVIDSANGEVRLWTGETLVVEQTGIDTGSTAISEVQTLSQRIDFDSSSRRIAYEDFWIDDAVEHLDARIASLRPDANGTHQDWTRSDTAVDAYTLVNNQPTNDDSQYVSSDTDGDRSTFDVDAIPSDSQRLDVGGVMVWASAEKTDTEDRTLAMTTHIGGVDYDGPEEDVATIDGFRNLWEDSPDTGSAWTKSEVDSAEYGVLGGVVST